jgi:DNA-binding XRE family transcriptional regulator
MTSQNAYLKHTEISESASISLVSHERPTGTDKGRVIYGDFSLPAKSLAIEGAIDIDDLVAELESHSDESAKSIAKGRKWVAENFYAGQESVAHFRLQKGWSQAELARRAETSQPYIARLEQGRVDPQISTARKIANALGITIETFVNAMDQEAQK